MCCCWTIQCREAWGVSAHCAFGNISSFSALNCLTASTVNSEVACTSTPNERIGKGLLLPSSYSMQRSLRCFGSCAFGNISSFSGLNCLTASTVTFEVACTCSSTPKEWIGTEPMLSLNDSMQRSLRCVGSCAFANTSGFSSLNCLSVAYVLDYSFLGWLVPKTSQQFWNPHRLAMQFVKSSGYWKALVREARWHIVLLRRPKQVSILELNQTVNADW